MNFSAVFLVTAFLLTIQPSFAMTLDMTDGQRLVGHNVALIVPAKNTLPLEYYSARYQTGLSNVLEANPGIDPFLPQPGYHLIIPNALILPATQQSGIIINSPEMRLYYYPPGEHRVVILPIGIGEVNRATPLDWTTMINRMKKHPAWVPTPRIRADYASQGIHLPAVFPPGPDNPMGLYALYIGNMYAIHGTNANFGIGLRVSHGCIRLRNADIQFLYEHVKIGTTVRFINQPVKFSQEPDGSKYIEVHEPLSLSYRDIISAEKQPIRLARSLKKALSSSDINRQMLKKALSERSGMPVKLN